jgi:hypothetical protein
VRGALPEMGVTKRPFQRLALAIHLLPFQNRLGCEEPKTHSPLLTFFQFPWGLSSRGNTSEFVSSVNVVPRFASVKGFRAIGGDLGESCSTATGKEAAEPGGRHERIHLYIHNFSETRFPKFDRRAIIAP